MWLSRLRIWHCHCSGKGSIPGQEFPHAVGMLLLPAKRKSELHAKKWHKDQEGRNAKYTLNSLHEVIWYHLKIDCDKLKMYVINHKATAKITRVYSL